MARAAEHVAAAPKPKLTEGIVAGLLRERFSRSGNGGAGEHAFLPKCRAGAGFSDARIFDAVSMDLWPSRGLVLHVYEIKVSRSDWQRELGKPEKAEDACKLADRFWIVAPVGCVKDGELPPLWGLIEVTGDGDTKPWALRNKVTAKALRPGSPAGRKLDRSFVVGMLRAAGAVPGGKVLGPDLAELAKARDEGIEIGRGLAKRDLDSRQSQAQHTFEAYQTLVAALVEHGVERWATDPGSLAAKAEAIAAALRDDKVEQTVVRQVRGVAEGFRRLLATLDELAPPGESPGW